MFPSWLSRGRPSRHSYSPTTKCSQSPTDVLLTKTVSLEHKPDDIGQDKLRQTCSKNISWKPQT
eukprot:2463177-Pyramimonas_sp.AAC.1